jgi:3-hydroxybutyryl-CoA dehydrogenase
MKKIGIIGAGAVGSGIAQVAATAGHEVLLYDTNAAALKSSSDNLQKVLNRLVEKDSMDDAMAKAIFGRIYLIDNFSSFANCDLIIEAIVERLDIKKKVFADLEAIVSEQCILATNTSSLSVASIAAACRHANRVLGIHFFNPAPLMQLVEIIPAVQTSSDTLAEAKKTIDSWGKLTVITKDTPGFIVNRVARPFYGEALRIYEEGIADVATIDWAMTEIGGFRMGPFTLMDYIGNDVNYAVTESVFESFYYDPRYKPAFTQKRLSEAGYLGKKSGKGYYDYSESAVRQDPKKDKKLGKKIVNRIVAMLINEAADAAYLNIASIEDIDLAMTKGVNYPKGLLAWADEIGIKKCVNRMDDLHKEYLEDRYRCSPLLRKMARTKKTFYGVN